MCSEPWDGRFLACWSRSDHRCLIELYHGPTFHIVPSSFHLVKMWIIDFRFFRAVNFWQKVEKPGSKRKDKTLPWMIGDSASIVADHKCLKGFAIIGSGLATLVSKVLGFEGIYGFTLITNGVSTTTLGHLGCTKPVCPG
jgi:hypothetical protein